MNIDNLKSQMRKRNAGILRTANTPARRRLRLRDDSPAERSASNRNGRHSLSAADPPQNDGLLAYRWEESLQGPPRKYYSITPLGLEFLGQLQASWDEISNSVNLLLANPPIITPITPNPLRLKD